MDPSPQKQGDVGRLKKFRKRFAGEGKNIWILER